MVPSGLFTAHIWQLRSLLSDTFSVHKTEFPYGPWKRPGRLPAASHAVFVLRRVGARRGVRGYLATQLLAVLCASVQFRENLHHFFPVFQAQMLMSVYQNVIEVLIAASAFKPF